MSSLLAITAIRGIFAGLGTQNFLGYKWIEKVLGVTPQRLKRRVALSFLGMSPHYFYRTAAHLNFSWGEFLESEFRRNRSSREQLIRFLVAPHLRGDEAVLDYGCGPGFLAAAVSPHVRSVLACDISSGTLACARIINGADNVDYRIVQKGHIPLESRSIDLIYTFAVIQHVTDEVLSGILSEWNRVLRPGGQVLCHVVLNGVGWHTERDWRSDATLKGRLKWRFGLQCFSRSPEDFTARVVAAGFTAPAISLIGTLAPELDDLDTQSLCVFQRA